MGKRVIALGFFDGVHLGHAALLRRVAEVACRLDAIPAAVTFDRHPEEVIFRRPVPLLNALEDRIGLMRRLYGIAEVLVIPFDEAMMHMPWREFVTDYLISGQGAVHLVSGHDFHFGYRGEGGPEGLRALCAELGVGCDIVPPVELGGAPVSSTRIRALLAEGETERAVCCLGHPHVLTGTVLQGQKIGRTIGFPTVNLKLPDGVLPPAFGVYAACCVLPDGSEHPAAVNIGVRPTVAGEGVTAEAHLPGFSGDLYGAVVRLELYTRLRAERRFPSVEALSEQIARDTAQTEQFFLKR